MIYLRFRKTKNRLICFENFPHRRLKHQVRGDLCLSEFIFIKIICIDYFGRNVASVSSWIFKYFQIFLLIFLLFNVILFSCQIGHRNNSDILSFIINHELVQIETSSYLCRNLVEFQQKKNSNSLVKSNSQLNFQQHNRNQVYKIYRNYPFKILVAKFNKLPPMFKYGSLIWKPKLKFEIKTKLSLRKILK